MTLQERLDRGDILIMDGGTGTEIQRRGSSLHDKIWSAAVLKSDPGLVRSIHEDYLRAGAEIIITNTFSSARHVLESAGLGEEFAALNRQAVEIAIAARDAVAKGDVWIAGSISSKPPLTDIGTRAQLSNFEQNYRDQAEILAEAGCDLLVAEMMLDSVGAAMVVRAAASVGIPLWVGFSAARTAAGDLVGFRSDIQNAALRHEDFGDLVKEILSLGGDLAGVMHSEVEVTGPALAVLAEHYDGPKMAYAETGRFTNPGWAFESVCAPEAYAEAASKWIREQGVQIIGGCCGTGPDHIQVLKDRLTG